MTTFIASNMSTFTLLALLIGAATSSASDVFAVTSETQCAESLPYGSCSAPLTKDSSAFFCTDFKDVIHEAFTQEFYVDDDLQFTIDWAFQSGPKTLETRFLDAVSLGEEVIWTIEAAPGRDFNGITAETHHGVWRFSNGATNLATSFASATGGTSFSHDDGTWGAAFNDGVSEVDGNGAYENSLSIGNDLLDGWGHQNYHSSDYSCNTWYANGVATSTGSIRNVMKLGSYQGTCFHGSTLVTLKDNSTKPLTDVELGDVIKTSDIHGTFSFSPVVSLPHEAGNTEMATFLKLQTETGKAVMMTPGHLVPMCDEKTIVTASELKIGDCLLTVDGKENLLQISSSQERGVYTAITEKPFLSVNGIVASPFSVENDPGRSKFAGDGAAASGSFPEGLVNAINKKARNGLRGVRVD